MKQHPPEVGKRFSECYFGEVVISAITLAGLEYGVICSNLNQAHNRAALSSLLEDIVVLPFEAMAPNAYGTVRQATRERKGDALDKLIASHAISQGIILVTNSKADFFIYHGIKIENWVGSH